MNIKYHNPENVPAEMLGEGWRLCTVDEIENPPGDAEWFGILSKQWRRRDNPKYPLNKAATYRTRNPNEVNQPDKLSKIYTALDDAITRAHFDKDEKTLGVLTALKDRVLGIMGK